ncbi:NUMOD4 domain-containing protein [Enterococcus faecium]|uniref:NUMOD4 domain-containing protein n=1 Tax=Enterococcus faecium TaxID=1352 RepID=UPI0011074823|nr:NUMOD4 domain-containing protein [Enterococcus faecium]
MINNTIENEVWKDVPGYEGLYQASNLGRVKSLSREHKSYGNLKNLGDIGKINITYKNPGKILSQHKSADGYLRCIFCKDGKKKMQNVHRVIAKAFIENPDNKPVVNHKDEDKTNNTPENLEWTTVKYNNSYGTRLNRVYNSEGYLNSVNRKKKAIKQFDKSGNLVAQYDSAAEACRINNNFTKSGINNCLKKRNEFYKGFKWFYV